MSLLLTGLAVLVLAAALVLLALNVGQMDPSGSASTPSWPWPSGCTQVPVA